MHMISLGGALCFLKDTWRIDILDIQAEGLIYKTLIEACVYNIPHCIAFGDISTLNPHLIFYQDVSLQ